MEIPAGLFTKLRLFGCRKRTSSGESQREASSMDNLDSGWRIHNAIRFVTFSLSVGIRTANAYTVWQAMGSPQHPMTKQYADLKAPGQLELLTSPLWLGRD
jgi:hypothetical protein